MIRVKCAVREVEILNTGGRCGAIVFVLFLAVSFLSACAELQLTIEKLRLHKRQNFPHTHL
jgi:hypothetical protein